VSIPSLAAIKARVRSISLREAQDLARRALACDSAEAVRGLVRGGGAP
jgi:phosphocarrier protein FPr